MEPFRKLEDLTLMDDYMFGAVMQDSRLLKVLIEQILDLRIVSISYAEPQKSIKEGFQTKGVRLDLFVVDDCGTVYNVEVQTTRRRHLPKRMRYYQSAIDMDLLSPGVDYEQLNHSYIIFICNHDPFGLNRCVYRFENRCVDRLDLPLGDGAFKVVVNTQGRREGVSAELRELIDYLNDGTVCGHYSRQLDDAVSGIKASEERRKEYMIMSLREQEIREEGRAIDRLDTIRRLVKKLGMTVQEAMDFLEIPSAEQGWYLNKLGSMPS